MTLPQILLELDATTLRPQDVSDEALQAVRNDAALANWWNKRAAEDHLMAAASFANIVIPLNLNYRSLDESSPLS